MADERRHPGEIPQPAPRPPADARTAPADADKKLVQEHEFDDPVDEASADSFPASDPPAWTLGTE